jgi:hypothetical protein
VSPHLFARRNAPDLLHQIVKHFHSSEQGAKAALTRKGIAETKDMIHDSKKGWMEKEAK